MVSDLRPLPLRFGRSLSGQEPVREWLLELPEPDKRVIGRDIAKVQFGWPVGLPLCRALAGGLWELRSSLPRRREARVLFAFYQSELIALHAFIKKSRTVDDADLGIARERMRDLAP